MKEAMVFKKQQSMAWVLFIGSLCIVGAVFSETTATKTSGSAPAVSVVVSPQYEGAEKRDPFIPYVTSDGQIFNVREEEETYLNLEGVIFDDKGGQSMAIINGQVLRKNDTIGNVKIVEIRKNSVVYVKDGTLFTLETKKEE